MIRNQDFSRVGWIPPPRILEELWMEAEECLDSRSFSFAHFAGWVGFGRLQCIFVTIRRVCV
jgi:hypothetical protein